MSHESILDVAILDEDGQPYTLRMLLSEEETIDNDAIVQLIEMAEERKMVNDNSSLRSWLQSRLGIGK